MRVSDACSFVIRYRLNLIGLLETKESVRNRISSQRSVFPTWTNIVANGSNRVGRMQVCWDLTRVVVDVIEISSQWIHVKAIFLESGILFVVSFAYGMNEVL